MDSAEFTKLQDLDIVVGRGKTYASLPGNATFRQLVQQYADDAYYSTDRLQKIAVAQAIAAQLEANRMRFVKRESNGIRWVLLNRDEGVVKIGQALRDVRNVRRRHEKKKRHQRTRAASPPSEDKQDGAKSIIEHATISGSVGISSGSASATTSPMNSFLAHQHNVGNTRTAMVQPDERGGDAALCDPASSIFATGNLTMLPMSRTITEHHSPLYTANTTMHTPVSSTTTPITRNATLQHNLSCNTMTFERGLSSSSRTLAPTCTLDSWASTFTLDDVADILKACCSTSDVDDEEEGE